MKEFIEGAVKNSKKQDIVNALIEQRYYNPHNVYHHSPEFYDCDDDRYLFEVRIVKWNTRSTRMTILFVRYDSKKEKYIFARKRGVKRTAHGEKMR